MSLHPQPLPAVPEETARVAHAAFPRDTIYLRMRDALGAIFADDDFADLFPSRGQPAEAPWRLALVTILQYVENLSDRQAADAVRSRIDWKYLLSLELTDCGFDSTVLSEFRTRLVVGAAEQRLLDALLAVCRERKWLKARGRQRTDSTHVLARVRAVNRLECVGETLRMPSTASRSPPLSGCRRIARRNGSSVMGGGWTITICRRKKRSVRLMPQVIGTNGHAFLAAIYAPQAPRWFRDIPAVETLRRVWVQQFYLESGQRALANGEGRHSPVRAFYQFPL